jgi:hypothetical protein
VPNIKAFYLSRQPPPILTELSSLSEDCQWPQLLRIVELLLSLPANNKFCNHQSQQIENQENFKFNLKLNLKFHSKVTFSSDQEVELQIEEVELQIERE